MCLKSNEKLCCNAFVLYSLSDSGIVIVDREQMEVLRLVHLVFLREDEDDSPQV